MSALANPINSGSNTAVLTTSVYAIPATGGYTMARSFDNIKFRAGDAIARYDVTQAVQILFDVATFNSKLGLLKDASNANILSTTFEPIDDRFENSGVEVSSITLSAANFTTGMLSKNVLSVGRYASLYSDFSTYVKAYFGYDGGFSSLFAAASEFAIDSTNSFTAASFVRLLTAEAVDISGRKISDLSGSITVSNITKLLRYAVDTNCFGNRTPSVDPSGTSVDPSYNSNYGVGDGFIEGDLIWIPDGTTIVLNVGIDAESFLPINNVGPNFGSALNTTQTTTFNTSYNAGLAPFSLSTTATTTGISRTAKAPLLIRLVNASTIAART